MRLIPKNKSHIVKAICIVFVCVWVGYVLFKNFSVAVFVNDKPIFVKRIIHLFETEFAEFKNLDKERYEIMFNQQAKRILEKEIDKQLIIQEGEKQNIQITSGEIDQMITEKLKERSYTDLDTYIHDYKTTLGDLRLEFRVELLSVKILGKDIIESSEQMKNCYQENEWIIWRCNQEVKDLFFKKIGEKYSPWLGGLRNSSNIRYLVTY